MILHTVADTSASILQRKNYDNIYFQCWTQFLVQTKNQDGLTTNNSTGKSSLTCIPVSANFGLQNQTPGGSDQMGLVSQIMS